MRLALSACHETPPGAPQRSITGQRSTGESSVDSTRSLDEYHDDDEAAELLEVQSEAVRLAAHAVARARAELTRQLVTALREIDQMDRRVCEEDEAGMGDTQVIDVD